MQIKDEEDFRIFYNTFKEVIQSGKWGPIFFKVLEKEDRLILRNGLGFKNLPEVFLELLSTKVSKEAP
jgi:hypothetical protein